MNGPPRGFREGTAVAVVAAAVVLGLSVLGSPGEERARRLDGRRVTDLRGIKAGTDLYWTRHAGLPGSLEELLAEPGVSLSPRDPDTSEPYAYRALDSIRYEVCASFERASEELSRDPERDLWAHGSGRQCFQLKAEDVTEAER